MNVGGAKKETDKGFVRQNLLILKFIIKSFQKWDLTKTVDKVYNHYKLILFYKAISLMFLE